MPLDRGPYEPLDAGKLGLVVEDTGFRQWELEHGALIGKMDAAIVPAESQIWSAAATDWRRALEQGLSAPADEIDAQTRAPSPVYGLADAYGVKGAIEQRIIDASAEIPPEGAEPVPAPWQPPPETGGFISDRDPTIPPGIIDPGLTLPPPGIPYSGPAMVSLVDITRPNTTPFRVGDMLQIFVAGQHASEVVVVAGRPPAPLSRTTMGDTDQWGRWWIQIALAAEHVGTWEEHWYVGGVQCSPVLHFTVAA